MTETNTCDLCKDTEISTDLIWITAEDFTPKENEAVPEELYKMYDALCEHCYLTIMDRLREIGQWEYDCLKREMKAQGDTWNYKGGFDAWYKEVFIIDEAWAEARELDLRDMGTTVCQCGLNPNYTQSEKQQKWEIDYIKKHGRCSACDSEHDNKLEPEFESIVS